MMKKNYFYRAVAPLLVVIALTLSGCVFSPEATPDPGPGSEGKKVILLTVDQSCDYCAKHTEAFEDMLEGTGVDLQVMVNDYDPAQQAQQVNQVIGADPDAVVVWPAGANAITPSLVRLQRAEIPVVVANSFPQAEDESLWDSYTGPDNHAEGAAAADAMVQGFESKGFGETGNVVVVTGQPGTPPAVERLRGFEERLSEVAPGISVVGTQPGNWDQTTATSAAAALLTQYRGPDLKGIYAQADNMLAGALVAAERSGIGPDDIVAVGQNCSIEGYTRIEDGAQYASVLLSPIEDGELAAKAVLDILNDKQVEKNIFIEPEIITTENLSDCDAAVGN